MRILVINGSPRRHGNTADLLNLVTGEAPRLGIDLIWHHLNDLSFRGCQSCFSCKEEEASGCALVDDLSPVLEAVRTSDALVIGSPIYIGGVTGQLKSFWDRLFGFIGPDRSCRLPSDRKAALVITQGVTDREAYRELAGSMSAFLESQGFQTRALVAPGLSGSQGTDRGLDARTQEEARDVGSWLWA